MIEADDAGFCQCGEGDADKNGEKLKQIRVDGVRAYVQEN